MTLTSNNISNETTTKKQQHDDDEDEAKENELKLHTRKKSRAQKKTKWTQQRIRDETSQLAHDNYTLYSTKFSSIQLLLNTSTRINAVDVLIIMNDAIKPLELRDNRNKSVRII